MMYVYSFVVLLLVDAIWLASMMSVFYKPRLAHLMADKVNFPAAGIFYVIYSLALTYLILLPAVKNSLSLKDLFIRGAIFGLAAYATYDLTNLATLKNWSVSLTVVDIIWGALLTGIVSVISVSLYNYFK